MEPLCVATKQMMWGPSQEDSKNNNITRRCSQHHKKYLPCIVHEGIRHDDSHFNDDQEWQEETNKTGTTSTNQSWYNDDDIFAGDSSSLNSNGAFDSFYNWWRCY